MLLGFLRLFNLRAKFSIQGGLLDGMFRGNQPERPYTFCLRARSVGLDDRPGIPNSEQPVAINRLVAAVSRRISVDGTEADGLVAKASEQRLRGRFEEALVSATWPLLSTPGAPDAFWRLALCQLDAGTNRDLLEGVYGRRFYGRTATTATQLLAPLES
jgi:hypothetical protein